MDAPKGILYGVGVGPGDPELLTLKAVRVLRSAPRVYAAASTKNSYSVSLSIVRPHLAPGVEPVVLSFPMTRDQAVLDRAWEENARTVLADLDAGRDVAFLTLGDPSTYSTFGYLLRTLRGLNPAVRAEVVPGVTSYCAAAALAGEPLAEADQTLAVVSGVCGGDTLRRAAEAADSLVVLKAYKRFADIRAALAEAGLLQDAVLVSACGQDGQSLVRDLAGVEQAPPYFSLVLAKKKRG
ncbi:MAG: precorrin-2 C(20)-methyltransferase [Thermodesulfobacteriota bacterium]